MSQAAQSTAVQHANARERLSDSDEGAVREYRVQNTDQALSLALKQGVGSPTTRVHGNRYGKRDPVGVCQS